MSNIDYLAEARRKQQEEERKRYQASRDPFEYGRQVAQRRYSEIMSGLNERQRQSARSYSDMYQAARQAAVSDRAMGGPSLSGGMRAQYSDMVSAREMQALGQIGAERERAAREIDLQRQSAFANAQLEGQQAEQLALQRQQLSVERVVQKQKILTDTKLTGEQKAEQLRALGFEEEAKTAVATPATEVPSWVGALTGGITGTIAGKGVLTAAAAKAGAGWAGLSFGAKAAAFGTGLLSIKGLIVAGAVLLTVDKVMELFGSEKGLFNIADFF